MDVTGMLLRAGGRRTHVLIAAMPGSTQVRLAAEEHLRRRGWPRALTPADADVLLVAGTPAEDIAPAVEAAWAAVPAPRVRVRAGRAGEVAAALDAACGELTGAAVRQREARGDGDGTGGVPGDLPMAGREPDRDGLKLDQLHVPLGPLLPDWPAGLVIRTALQGDVVQQAEVEHLGVSAAAGSFWDEPWRRAASGEPVTAGEAARRRAAAHLDSLGRFLAVAGWDGASVTARRLRDETLDGANGGTDGETNGRSLGRNFGRTTRTFAARVARSRLLAWSTRGMEAGVTARYRRWCDDIGELAGWFGDASPLADRHPGPRPGPSPGPRPGSPLDPPRGPPAGGRPPSAAMLEMLPGLLRGTELAAARLIVASLDPDLDELSVPVTGHRHGG